MTIQIMGLQDLLLVKDTEFSSRFCVIFWQYVAFPDLNFAIC